LRRHLEEGLIVSEKLIVAPSLIVLASTAVMAQTAAPGLVGTWTGIMEGVVAGSRHEHTDPATEPRFDAVPFILTVERQEDRRFVGTWASTRATDRLIGMARAGGRRLEMVDDDGVLTAELHGPDEMEVCRHEVGPDSGFVGCGMFTRQP
jgi:hypothetical protein